jgi:hypothetical protein
MIYFASATRIVEIGDHSDLVIKERQQMGQFLFSSHAFNYSDYLICHFIVFISAYTRSIAVLLFF